MQSTIGLRNQKYDSSTLKKLINGSPLRLSLFLFTLALACFALSPSAQALSPPPDGGYPLNNTAEGENALLNVNLGVGFGGANNTALGCQALQADIKGGNNTAIGAFALLNNRNDDNTAIGVEALKANTQGQDNTAIGVSALANNTGSNNVALGAVAGNHLTTGSNNIVIGSEVAGDAGDSNTIRIGKGITRTLIDGINGATASGGAAVFVVGEGGRLGTLTSSARFKDDIKPMDKASEAVLALKPVSFRYKKEVDPRRVAQFGLVAEDVEKINPDLVIRDAQGRPQTVRYEQVNAMLLNEFLKEHRKVERLEATVAQQHKDFEAAVAELKGQIQRVSAQLETTKPAPQVVNNL